MVNWIPFKVDERGHNILPGGWGQKNNRAQGGACLRATMADVGFGIRRMRGAEGSRCRWRSVDARGLVGARRAGS